MDIKSIDIKSVDIKRVLVLCFIVLTIVICSIFIKTNIELNKVRQELSNTQNEVSDLNNSLQIESNKNKDMEETISNLNLELSIANEKIVNMQNTGVPVYFTEEEVNYIAKTVYGEARGCSKIQQSAVVWCILNRLDNEHWGSVIKSVVTAPTQFHGYSKHHPVTDEIRELVEDVLLRWNMEKMGVVNVGRTLPERFMYFNADRKGSGNLFTTSAGRGEVWNWDCWNPYE